MTVRKAAAKKKKAKPAARKRAKAPANNGDEHVAQIRELIFGEQMTGYEERFAALEKKLTDDVQALKATVQANLRELRKLMKERAKAVESASVPRDQIADSFERLAKTLRR
jgi:hypothetical protein